MSVLDFMNTDSLTNVGFRTHPIGALQSPWSMVQGTTPADIAVASLDGALVARTPIGSTVQPFARHVLASGINGVNRYFRMKATCRAFAPGAGAPGAFFQATFGISVGTASYLFFALRKRDTPDNVGDLRITGNGLVASIPGPTVINFQVTVEPNKWYRLMFEQLGDIAQYYFNPVAYSSPNDALDDTLLEYRSDIGDRAVAPNRAGESPAVFLSSNVITATDCSAITDVTFEQFSGSQIAPVTVPPIDETLTPYRTYKTIRAAANTLNMLVLSP